MTLKPLTSSIHIKTHPAPRSLSESKLILSALQKFGEVVTFRNLKYDPTNTSPKSAHNTIAIFESAAAASSAIAASPITIPVQSQTQNQSQSQSLEGKDESPSHTATHPTQSQSQPQPQPQGPTLTCTIQPSRHNHVSAMTRNPYHTFFYVDKGSHMYKDLVKSGIPLDYLADGPMRRKAHVPERVKRMLDRDVWRFGGKSLMGLYRFGVKRNVGMMIV
ncbi:uncharacterized protein BO88DRAFT_374031 [Aspergillus vadensis CBS 113365]|uniref:Uncharacterized protein n=1 Tax=Aspergillus vadensis (strain CBS 113365 / IMI 142717 / IBT 24658) TaxID=1448311 RepID=A0A319AW91_ASPVC|nr:hypothetical protein BO88DRAFT_374031 [Aspergillus vadensis CBS 113365]PYH64627.1 hypothetical protein BO88DRAFT_374031 [Aspergillus vadensis CBS 113365]